MENLIEVLPNDNARVTRIEEWRGDLMRSIYKGQAMLDLNYNASCRSDASHVAPSLETKFSSSIKIPDTMSLFMAPSSVAFQMGNAIAPLIPIIIRPDRCICMFKY